MTSPNALLAEFVRNGSEPAFGQLVGRYLDLVYSTAMRLVGGDRHLAEDVSQTVFVHLARKAGGLPREVNLGGWLHRDTCFVARTLMRRERRRWSRERQAVEMSAQQDHTAENLARLTPILDEAINELGDEDRQAVLLRFFEQRDFRSVGQELGGSEDAARMRVNRALDKLQGLCKQREVALSVTALGPLLAGQVITAVPAGLASTITGAALAGTAATAGSGMTLLKFMSMTKTGIISAMAVAAVATPLAIQHRTTVKLGEENQELRAQGRQLAQLITENERLSNLVARAGQPLLDQQMSELLRLRSEVGTLRRQARETEKLTAENRRLRAAQASAQNAGAGAQTPAEDPDPAAEQWKQIGIAKLTDAKLLVMGLLLYADKNQGRYATSLDQVLPYLSNLNDPAGGPAPSLTGTNKFELVYQGGLSAISNPASTIVLREPDAWQASNGNWQRTYGFADSHSEVHSAPDGNFGPWEQQHLAVPARTGQ